MDTLKRLGNIFRRHRLLAGLLVVLFVLLALETVTRIAATILRDAKDDSSVEDLWYRYSRDLGWERRPGFSGIVYNKKIAFDERGFFDVDSAQVDREDGLKIMLIGDSCTFGILVDVENTFGEILEDSLPDATVINLAVVGHTSYQGVQILERYLDVVRPDIVVASFNFNDRRSVRNESRIDAAEWFRQVYVANRVIPAMERISYIVRAMRWGLHKLPFAAPDKNVEVDLTTLLPRVSPADYRENLIKMTALAGDRSARLVFLLLSDNPKQTRPLLQGRERLRDERDFDAGVEQLRKIANTEENVYATLAAKYLSAAFDEKGLHEEARRIGRCKFFRSLHGGNPVFLDTDYSSAMRDVASEYNVPLVDAASVLNAQPGVYSDFCHFDKTGHAIVAHALHDAIQTMQGNAIGPLE